MKQKFCIKIFFNLKKINFLQEKFANIQLFETEKGNDLNNDNDNDFIIKNALTIFNLLKKNFIEMKSIRQEIIELLSHYNVEINDENFNDESFNDLVNFFYFNFFYLFF